MKKLSNLFLIFCASSATLLPAVSSACDYVNFGSDQKLIERIKELEHENEIVQTSLNAKISELETTKKTYDQQLAKKDIQIKQHQENIAQLNIELETLKTNNKIKNIELKSQIDQLLDKINSINDLKISYQNQIKTNQAELEELKSSMSSNQDTIDKLNKSLEVKKAYLTELESNINSLNAQIEQLKKEMEQSEKNLTKKQNEINQNKKIIDILSQEKLALNHQVGELKNEKIKLLKEHEIEISNKNKKIVSLESLLLESNSQSSKYTNAKNLLAIYEADLPLQTECALEFEALKLAINDIKNDNNKENDTILSASYSSALTSAISLYTDSITKLNIINSELESHSITLPTNKFENLIEYLKELMFLINRNKNQVIEQYNRKLESYAKSFNLISKYQVSYNPIIDNKQLNLPNLISQASDNLKFNIWSYISLNISECDQMNIASIQPDLKQSYQNLKDQLTRKSYINLSFEYLLSSFQTLLKIKENLIKASEKARSEAYENKTSTLKAIEEFEKDNYDIINYINELPAYKELQTLMEAVGDSRDNYDILLELCTKAKEKLVQVRNESAQIRNYYNNLKQEVNKSISALKQLQAEIDKWVNTSQYYKQNNEIQAMLQQISSGIGVLESIDWKVGELGDINSKIQNSDKTKENIQKLWDKFEADMNKTRRTEEIAKFYKDNHATVEKLIVAIKAQRNLAFSNYNIYDSIFKRTFKIVFNNQNDANSNEYTYTLGTAWLLDYVNLGNNKYRLYLGTNLHVANANIDKNDYSDNRQQNKIDNGFHTNSSFIGFDPNWSDGKNQYYMYQFMNNWDSHALYIPKNFYIATNFISPDKVKGNVAADFAVLEWYVDLNEFAKWSPRNFSQTVQFYDPEASVAGNSGKVRKEYSTLINTGQLQAAYVQHIKDAIAQVDASKVAVEKRKMANFSSNLPYISVDYMSAENILKEYNKMYPDNKINNYLKPESYKTAIYLDNFINNKLGNNKIDKEPNNVFIAGYPAKDGNKTEINGDWSKLNETGDNIYNYNLTDPVAEYSVEFNPKSTIDYNGILYDRYMLQFYSSSVNNLTGGSSGSIAVNQDNLPIGIKWGSIVNGETKYFNESGLVHSYRDVVVSFVNSFDKLFYSANKHSNTLYAYNLIDGTNKNNYPYQINSYRHELVKRYGTEYKTALFNK
ncbi:MIP family Ig-specific serine endopeptidase [Mycoplasma sp. 1458C]|uniref:MIP family Ig-specific serine endopeptidase n=1 Tax=unclassified Mycoplasma TaxID=2683645 RepID=UPI003AADAC00